MSKLLTTSLIVNIAVLVPVCANLLLNTNMAVSAWGPASPARGILLSIYLAILAASAGLLVKRNIDMCLCLLGMQIIYKFTTPFTVGSWANPVVISNLVIATLHGCTLVSLWRGRRAA